jgi:hypothetical protein
VYGDETVPGQQRRPTLKAAIKFASGTDNLKYCNPIKRAQYRYGQTYKVQTLREERKFSELEEKVERGGIRSVDRWVCGALVCVVCRRVQRISKGAPVDWCVYSVNSGSEFEISINYANAVFNRVQRSFDNASVLAAD